MPAKVIFHKFLNFLNIRLVKKHFNYFKNKVVAHDEDKEETVKIVRKKTP